MSYMTHFVNTREPLYLNFTTEFFYHLDFFCKISLINEIHEAIKREPYPTKDITIPVVVVLSANMLIPIKKIETAYRATIKKFSIFISFLHY